MQKNERGSSKNGAYPLFPQEVPFIVETLELIKETGAKSHITRVLLAFY